MKTDMDDLFELVLHAIEGNEKERLECHSTNGMRIAYRHSFGPDRWIEEAALGRLRAINALAVILFSVRNAFDLEDERRIVEKWATELRAAAEAREITPRDLVTLLPLQSVPDGWDWLISIADADSFVAARGMGWTCSERVDYLLEQSRRSGESWYAEDGTLTDRFWLKGYEPESQKGCLGWTADGDQAQPDKPSTSPEHWMMKIQAEATSRWKEQRAMGCNPTRRSMKDELAKWCREENILTASGINPSADYIYRHVIAKRVWRSPRNEAS